jgi:hypothetical protein
LGIAEPAGPGSAYAEIVGACTGVCSAGVAQSYATAQAAHSHAGVEQS